MPHPAESASAIRPAAARCGGKGKKHGNDGLIIKLKQILRLETEHPAAAKGVFSASSTSRADRRP